jgi:predicted nucleotidyltransferase
MALVDDAMHALKVAPSVASVRVQGVWLFGSVARAQETDESDVDLAILCDPPLGLERTRTMDEIGRALGRDVDVIDLATAPPSLTWEILTTGRLLVEDDPEAVEAFVRRARYAADDDEQLSRLALLAQVGTIGGDTR